MKLIKKIIILSGENGFGLVKILFYNLKAEIKAQYSLPDMELGLRIGDRPMIQHAFRANKCEWTFDFDYNGEPIVAIVVDPAKKRVLAGGNTMNKKISYTTDGFCFSEPVSAPDLREKEPQIEEKEPDAMLEKESCPCDAAQSPEANLPEDEPQCFQAEKKETARDESELESETPPCAACEEKSGYVYREYLCDAPQKDAELKEEKTLAAGENGDGQDDIAGEQAEPDAEILKKNGNDKKKRKFEAAFYHAVKPQIDELFICYPREETIERLVEDSRWVRINYEKDDYYVVGVLEEEGEVRYICYGVPAEKDIVPPKDIEDLCEYLPLNETSGYWVMFQDAEDGKTLTGNKKS